MSAPDRPATQWRDVLAPPLVNGPSWKVFDTGPGGGTAVRVWPDETTDSLVVINPKLALFRREAGDGRGLGSLIEGPAGDVVDAVRVLPPPPTVDMVIDPDPDPAQRERRSGDD